MNTNIWDTNKEDIDPKEYCIECEQDTRLGHYNNCPTNPVQYDSNGIPTESKKV